MRILLDTNVVSELQRSQSHPRVRAALEQAPAADLALSVISLGELEKGVALLEEGLKKTLLAAWLQELQGAFAARILPITAPVAALWGRAAAAARRRGLAVSVEDGLIAATARHHGLVVYSRNSRDLTRMGATVFDPWSGATHGPDA